MWDLMKGPRTLSILLPSVKIPAGKSARLSRREPHDRPAEVRDVPVIAEWKTGHDSKDLASMMAVVFMPSYARI